MNREQWGDRISQMIVVGEGLLTKMHQDWGEDRETMAKVYAAGMEACQNELLAAIERKDYQRRHRKWALHRAVVSKMLRQDCGGILIKQIARAEAAEADLHSVMDSLDKTADERDVLQRTIETLESLHEMERYQLVAVLRKCQKYLPAGVKEPHPLAVEVDALLRCYEEAKE